VDFDLSFLIARSQVVEELLNSTSAAGSGLIESARVFDEFSSEGLADKKAVAIRYRLRASDRTLTNEEVAPIRQAMIDAAAELGAELRGA
jgi:phenylalanyl-tRNA synthetase beta chain